MIVKNEAHLLAETLSHLTQYFKFDYWVIDDTGSTDGTQDIIRWFFGRLGISGELHETPWENFGTNRSRALDHAYNKTDYVLVWDADDSIGGKFYLPTTLTADIYSFIFGNASGFRYSRPQLFNNRKRWKYVGVLHEYPTCIDTAGPVTHIEGDYYFISGRGGARSQDSAKYLKDAAVLESGLEKEPSNHRYAFYCANSYRDAQDYPKATAMYKRVLEMGGWNEEKYMACLRIYDMAPSEENLHYLVRGHKFSPNRVEVIVRLARHYTAAGQHDVAYAYYTLVQDYYENRYMRDTIALYLFVHREDFDFFLPYFIILAALTIGRHDTAIRLFDMIFTRAYQCSDMFYINALFHNMYAIVDKMTPSLEFLAKMLRYRALFPELKSLQPVTDMIARHAPLLHDAGDSLDATEVQSLICSQLFIVNLDRRADRRASMKAELGKQGISNYCFHTAVDGAQLVATPELRRIFAGNDFQNRRGILGCAMSHYGLWQKVCAENRGFMIVLEDDITLCSNFQKGLGDLVAFMMSESAAEGIDVLFLGETLDDVSGREYVDGTGAPARPITANTYIGGAFGYIVTKRGAHRLLEAVAQRGMKRATDAFMVHSAGVSCWVAQPHIVHTGWVCAATPLWDSDIQRDGSTLELGPAPEGADKWAFYSCKDSRGDDLICMGRLPVKSLFNVASSNPLCYAVNTGGWIKHRVTLPLITEPSYTVAAGDGIYIRAPSACVFVDLSGTDPVTQLAHLAAAHAQALKEKKALRIRLTDSTAVLHPMLRYYAPAICDFADAAGISSLSGDIVPALFEHVDTIRSALDIEALGDAEDASSEKCVIYIHHSGDNSGNDTTQYYLRAALDMRHLYPATTFDIYSNDLAWCRAQPWLRGSNFVEVSDPAYILRNLIRYRRHIVSHSDMSWCGAWLAVSGSSTVVMSPATPAAAATARTMPHWSPVPV